ncbi:MAG: LptF/LptG family permease [Proteobacteria bacterium]|nr:LptF/LptG family permease [Pseudomonadota bacterium]
MKTLQRYYLNPIMKLSLVFSFIIVFLYSIADLFNNLSFYINKHAQWFDIFKYYTLQTPALFIMFFPLGLLTSIYFSLAHRGKWNENTAVKSLGIKTSSLTNIVLYISALLTILLVILNLYFVPRFNSLSDKIKSEKIDHIVSRHRYERDIYFIGSNRILYTARYIDTKMKKLFTLTILKSDSTGTILERDDCDYARWTGSFWQLFNVRKRIFSKKEGVFKYNDLKSVSDSSLNVPPDKLITKNITINNMTINELFAYAHYMKSIGQTTKRIYTQIYYLLFYPISILILAFLGIALGTRVKSTSNLFEFGLSLLIGFFYWGTLQSFRALGDAGGLSPVLANIFPHLIFFAVMLFTITFLKKFSDQR